MSSGRPPYPEAQCHFMNTDGRDELTAYMAANLPMLRLLAYMDSTGRAGGSYNTFAAGPSPDNPITVPRPTIHNNWGVGSAQIPEPLSRYMGYLGLPPL